MDENLALQSNEDNIENQPDKNKSTYKIFSEWCTKPHSRILISACAIFGFIFTCFIFVFQVLLTPIQVVGASMQPTININAVGSDHSINTDIVYYRSFTNYSYKDIVIIDGDYAHGVKKIIKRVIASPGQTIKFIVEKEENEKAFATSNVEKYLQTKVYVDDVELSENYIKEIMKLKVYKSYNADNYEASYYEFYNDFIKDLLDGDKKYEYTLKSGEYFCMGDNRNNSIDSRYFGPVRADDINGKVTLQVPYGESLFAVIWKQIFG